MKLHFIRTVLVLAVLALMPIANHAADAKPRSPLDGTWRWDFVMPDSGAVRPTLNVKTEDSGKITGIARFRSGSRTPVTNLKFKDNQVSFEVVRERDGEKTVTKYSGVLQGDKITGQVVSKWTGEEQSYDWVASRFADIEGVWKWRFSFGTNAPGGQGAGQGGGRRGGGGGGRGGGAGEITLTLKREEGEKISGKLNVGRGDQDIKHGLVQGAEVSFQTERERSTGEQSTNWYWGKFSGDTITGKYTTDFGGEIRTNDWRALRGD